METKTYNGWTNYATWRVNLEIIDGFMWDEKENTFKDIGELREYIKDTVETAVFGDDDTSGLMSSYALAFLQEVNYHEIAEHVAVDYPSIITGVSTSDGEKIN